MAEFYLDHNLTVRIAAGLQGLGHSAVTAADEGLDAANDATQLMHAAARGWILLTNDDDFIVLHGAWVGWPVGGRQPMKHAGILIIPQEKFPARECAVRIDAFGRGAGPLGNSIWRWTPRAGWHIPPY